MNWMEGWPMGFMWFGPLIFLLLIAALVWALARGMGPGASMSRQTPEDILKERYARGEIDQDDYKRRLSDLRK